MRVCVKLIRDFQHAVDRRLNAVTSIASRRLELARQKTSPHALPCVVVREGGDLARPGADLPKPVETRIGAGEPTLEFPIAENLGVLDLERRERHLGTGRVELNARIALLTLDERRDKTSRAADAVDLVAVDVAGKRGDVERGTEVPCAGLARETALLAETVGMVRVRNAHHGTTLCGCDVEHGIATRAGFAEVETQHLRFAACRIRKRQRESHVVGICAGIVVRVRRKCPRGAGERKKENRSCSQRETSFILHRSFLLFEHLVNCHQISHAEILVGPGRGKPLAP